MIYNFQIRSIFLIFVVLYYVVQSSEIKVALIGSGDVHDLSFDYQTNLALREIERSRNIKFTDYFGNITSENCLSFCSDLIDNQGYTVIMAPSIYYHSCIDKLTYKYLSQNIYFLYHGDRPLLSYPNNRTFIVDFNYEIINYFFGFYAGMATKTDIVGYVSSGGPSSYVSNAFFVGVRETNPKAILKYYTIGGLSNPELSIGAAEELLRQGADVIGQNLQDMSIPFTLIEKGKGFASVGSTGFDQTKIGSKVSLYYTMNWTPLFNDLISLALTNSSVYGSYRYKYGDTRAFIKIHIGKDIDENIKKDVQNEIEYTKSLTRSKSRVICSELNDYVFDVDQSRCVVFLEYFNLTDPYPDMIYLGDYKVPIEFQKLPASISKIFIIISVFLILLSMVLSGSVYYHRDTPIFRFASPTFCILIIFGGVMVYCGVIVWSLPITTITCHLRLWFVSEGFTILIGSIVVKNFRIWLIFDNPELKTIKITNLHLFPWIFILGIINTFLMVIISYRGDIRIENIFAIDGLSKYQYLHVFQMNQMGWISLYALLCYFGVLLTVGLYVSWKIRIVDIAEFNESRPIANTLYTIAFCITITLTLVVSPQTHYNQTIILCISGLFITTSTLLILFIPKLLNLNSTFLPDSTQSIIATIRYMAVKERSNNNSFSHPNKPVNMFAKFTDDTFISNNSESSNSINNQDFQSSGSRNWS